MARAAIVPVTADPVDVKAARAAVKVDQDVAKVVPAVAKAARAAVRVDPGVAKVDRGAAKAARIGSRGLKVDPRVPKVTPRVNARLGDPLHGTARRHRAPSARLEVLGPTDQDDRADRSVPRARVGRR